MDLSCCGSFIYLRYYINACVTLFLKVGFHWISPKDCTVGLHLAGSPGESGEGIRVGSRQLGIRALGF